MFGVSFAKVNEVPLMARCVPIQKDPMIARASVVPYYTGMAAGTNGLNHPKSNESGWKQCRGLVTAVTVLAELL